MTDLSKIKPGDEVTVRVSVVIVGDDIKVAVPGISGGVWISANAIVSHTPKALSVGDRVKLQSGGEGFIRAIVGERAWVDLVDDPGEMLNGCAYGLLHLERA
jgi:hypothetical protein